MLTPWKYTACKWTFDECWLECFIWSVEVCCSHIKKAVWYGGQIVMIKTIKIRKLIWIFSLCALWFILYCMFFISCPVFMFPNLFSWKHPSVISFVALELSTFVPLYLSLPIHHHFYNHIMKPFQFCSLQNLTYFINVRLVSQLFISLTMYLTKAMHPFSVLYYTWSLPYHSILTT